MLNVTGKIISKIADVAIVRKLRYRSILNLLIWRRGYRNMND